LTIDDFLLIAGRSKIVAASRQLYQGWKSPSERIDNKLSMSNPKDAISRFLMLGPEQQKMVRKLAMLMVSSN
jgi:hypothetical protein